MSRGSGGSTGTGFSGNAKPGLDASKGPGLSGTASQKAPGEL